MTYLRAPKFWLLTTAALMFGSQMSAHAQVSSSYSSSYSQDNYDYGTPTMVAAAPSLPAVRAEQIAQDVKAEYNPRTGRTELVAAPFDPFEQDPSLAGSLRLRSADDGVAIDGQSLRGGAIVDVDFYYNSPSDDPYGGRNYSDASFINGQLAPVVTRDTRILECSTRVDNVIYDSAHYYNQTPYAGIYRPYRHYAGHSGFGFGFGSSYFGPGYSFYNSNRSNFGRIRGNIRTPRIVRGVRSDYRDDRRDDDRNRDRDRDRNGDREEGRADSGDGTRTRGQGLTERQRENRLRAMQFHRAAGRYGRSTFRAAVPRDLNVIGTDSPQTQTQTQSRAPKVAPQLSQSDLKSPERRGQSRRSNTQQPQTDRNVTRRSAPRRAASSTRDIDRRESPRTESPRSTPTPSRPSASRPSTPKESSSRSSSSRASSSRSSRSQSSRDRPTKSRASSSRTTKSRSPSSRGSRSRQLDFFPTTAQGGGQVLTSHSVDCAREDKLSVFVSNERLDAARFDGLTLIALDAQGGETPIYIPPNYIEGYRLAASGQIRPQGYQAQPPFTGEPAPIQAPSHRLESAPCPAGTSKQPDETCLQNSVSGYPVR